MMSEVDYLGHKIDAIGIHPLADRVESIRNAKVPENITELRAKLRINVQKKLAQKRVILSLTIILHR